MDLGPHAAFIWASYGAFIAIVGALIAWTVYDGKRQRGALEAAERQGLTRRSGPRPGEPSA